MISAPADEDKDDAASLEYVPCNLCGSSDSDVVFPIGPHNIVRCRRCGLTYVSPRLSHAALAGEYEEGYFFGGSYQDYMSERRGFDKTFDDRLSRIEKFVKPARIVDIGCAFGFFLAVAERRGWDAWGVEPSAVPCRYARDELGLRAIHSTLREASFPDSYFDAAILNDVFEHLSDPSAELLELYRVLKTGGYLFIVTQDIDSLIVRVLGSRWAQYKPREHLYYFTEDTLRSILEKSNFSVIRIESEGLVCTVNFLVGKLKSVSRTLGMAAGFLAHGLHVKDALIPVRPGYEVMVYARRE